MGPALSRLLTDLGERSTYDAASQCSRCGYCEQSCPTYVQSGRESMSPRGRNQLVRLLLEGKLGDPDAAREALSTCLLCGACQTTCYAHVPTPDLVLEGRRLLAGEQPPFLARAVARLLLGPAWLRRLCLKAAYLAKRAGVSRLLRPLLRALGFEGLALADEHVEQAPLRFLEEELAGRPGSGSWLYFAACGPNYVLPRVGRATVKALDRACGAGGFLHNGCCGLAAYNYGRVEDAQELAKRVIRGAAGGGEPIVADCSSCAAFLKSYPQLFLDDAGWKAKAEAFAARVRDVVELLEEKHEGFQRATEKPTVYHESCRACHGQGLTAPDGFLEKTAPRRPLADAQVCCGGAGAYAFAHPELSEELLEKKCARIKESGATLVLASATSCLLQLARGLKNYYPQATVMHVSELAALSDGKGNP